MRAWVTLCFVCMVTAVTQATHLEWDASPDLIQYYEVFINGTSFEQTQALRSTDFTVPVGDTWSFTVRSCGMVDTNNDGTRDTLLCGAMSPTLNYTQPPPPPTELCGADTTGDGVDNDFDGLVDEGCNPPAISLFGATSPPEWRIVDDTRTVWTVGSDRRIYRNYFAADSTYCGGTGDLILWWSDRKIYVRNNQAPDGYGHTYSWWKFVNPCWEGVPDDPRVTPPPPPLPTCKWIDGSVYQQGQLSPATQVRTKDFDRWMVARKADGWLLQSTTTVNKNFQRVVLYCQGK